MSHGLRKRRIYYNMEYSEEEKNYISEVKKSLKEKSNIRI